VSSVDPLNRLVDIARDVAARTPAFMEIKGAGKGDQATAAFMHQLRARVAAELPEVKIEQPICGENNLAVDFFLPDQATVVEVALSLRNPLSEFETDIIKVLMAKEVLDVRINRLVFISKPGALKRHNQPGSKDIVNWAKRFHDLTIETYEIGCSTTRGG
jgi:hypothetical protein